MPVMTTTAHPGAGTTLAWGRHYAVVRPDHFRIDYVINPYMFRADQPDPALAMSQWETLVATLGRLGARVDVIEQRAEAPDMVYTMNLGLALTSASGSRVALSHMRHQERRVETAPAVAWFTRAGFTPTLMGQAEVGPCFEAGDAFPFGGDLVVGVGPRTEEQALEWLAREFEVVVRGLRIRHPGMYHLDLAFCPLDAGTALVCPAAFDERSANAVVVGRTIVMPVCPDRVRHEIESRGFVVELVDVSEFHKGGGSVRCLTNPLDILIGRDVAPVAGGAVLLP